MLSTFAGVIPNLEVSAPGSRGQRKRPEMSNTDPNREKRTVVEAETEFRGTITSNCPVVVLGKVDGELEAPAIDVSNTGEVVGTIKAEKIRAEGTLAGEVDAGDLYLSGTVKKDTVIRARSLEVKLARRGGQLELTFGEGIDAVEPEEVEQAVEAKSAPHTPPADAPTSSPAEANGVEPDEEESRTDVDDLFADGGPSNSALQPA